MTNPDFFNTLLETIMRSPQWNNRQRERQIGIGKNTVPPRSMGAVEPSINGWISSLSPEENIRIENIKYAGKPQLPLEILDMPLLVNKPWNEAIDV